MALPKKKVDKAPVVKRTGVDRCELLFETILGPNRTICEATAIPNVGCTVSTLYLIDNVIVAATSTFIPGVVITDDENGGNRLVAASDARRR